MEKKRISLRKERLTDLSADEMRGLIGLGVPLNDATISDGSCVCTDNSRDMLPFAGCNISAGSCVCGGRTCMTCNVETR